MKFFTTVCLVLCLNVTAFAAESRLYFVEPMQCTGEIYGETARVPKGFYKIHIQLVSFKSTRLDGSLANSLEVAMNFYHMEEAIDLNASEFDDILYMGPLVKSDDKVKRKSLSGRNDHLDLKISERSRVEGKRVDHLTGTYFIPESAEGAYGYKLECEARVVRTPTRVDDFRRD